jgi:hypothetical protein
MPFHSAHFVPLRAAPVAMHLAAHLSVFAAFPVTVGLRSRGDSQGGDSQRCNEVLFHDALLPVPNAASGWLAVVFVRAGRFGLLSVGPNLVHGIVPSYAKM